jgi:drug/metabolite transporter (DMT)-like permease
LTPSVPPTRARLLFAILTAVLAISSAAILIRAADAPPLAVASGRLGLAGLALLPWTARAWRRERVRPGSPALRLAVLAGVFLALHFAFWITSLGLTSVAASVTLVTTTPVWMTIMTTALGEPTSPVTWLGVLIAVAGGVLVGLAGSETGDTTLGGNLLALAGAVSVAVYLLLGRSAQRTLSTGLYLGLAYGSAGVILLVAALAAGQSPFAQPAVFWFWVALLAALPQLVGHSTFNWLMRYLPATLVTMLVLTESIGASLLALAIFGEVPGWQVIAGASLLLSGVAVCALARPALPRARA